MTFEEYKQLRLAGKSPEEAYQGASQGASQEGFSLGKTVGNIPRSAGEFIGGVGSAILHPIRTVKALGGIAAGGVEKLIPGQQAEEKYFDSLTDFYGKRYGSFDKVLTTVQNDPIGFLADASTVLTAGGALATKIGVVSNVAKVTNVGGNLSRAGQLTNPLTAAGKLSESTKALFPTLAKSLEKSNLRLTPTREGALATQGINYTDDAINITKNRLNEVTDFLSKQQIVGNPVERFAKATSIYNKTEQALDDFFSHMSKGSVVKKDRVIKALNGLKGTYSNSRDFLSIKKQIDSAIQNLKVSSGGKDTITYSGLNKFKRTTFENAYNKAGEKVVDGVEHAIGDTIRGILDEDLRGLKIAGQTFEQFNHNYGLLIESRKLLKMAVGKPEISAITERILGGMLGYALGGASGVGTGGLGALGGFALGKSLFESMPVTKVKSAIGSAAQTVGTKQIPASVRKVLPSKGVMTGVQRAMESQR